MLSKFEHKIRLKLKVTLQQVFETCKYCRVMILHVLRWNHQLVNILFNRWIFNVTLRRIALKCHQNGFQMIRLYWYMSSKRDRQGNKSNVFSLIVLRKQFELVGNTWQWHCVFSIEIRLQSAQFHIIPSTGQHLLEWTKRDSGELWETNEADWPTDTRPPFLLANTAHVVKRKSVSSEPAYS